MVDRRAAPHRRRGAVLVNWLQDIYPEVATELGVPLPAGAVVEVHWSLAHLTLALTTGVAFAMTSAAGNRFVSALLDLAMKS